MCVCVCLYVEPVSRSKHYVRSGIKTGSVLCLCTRVSPSVPEIQDIYAIKGPPFFSFSFFFFFFLERCEPVWPSGKALGW